VFGPEGEEWRIKKFYVSITVHLNKFPFNRTNRRTNFQIYSGTQFYMFLHVCIKYASAECTMDNS
jgi:hypothetical protein